MNKHRHLLVAATMCIGGCLSHAPTVPPAEEHGLPTGEVLLGAVSATFGSDVNRYVPDPEKQFIQLKDQGDYYGFHTRDEHLDTTCNWRDCKEHWQGLARLAYPENARQYFLAASSHLKESRLAVVKIGDTSGLRLRGNRHSISKRDWVAPPDATQEIVRSELMESTLNHPGGMQAIGKYVAIGMERIDDERQGKVYLYDVSRMSDASNDPVKQWEVGIEGQKVATASIVKLAPLAGEEKSRYLLITLGPESVEVTFNLSRERKELYETDAFSPTANGVTVAEASLKPKSAMPGGRGWKDGYQTMQILVDAAGRIYLLGGTRTKSDGVDFLDLFALRLSLTGEKNEEENPTMNVGFAYLANKTMYCSPGVSGSMGCDFASAGGAYIDPEGRLYYYATVHSDATLHGAAGPWTRMMEFRPRDHLDLPDTPAVEGCPELSSAWVDLYDGKLTQDRYGSFGPVGVSSFIIDYEDRMERARAGYISFPNTPRYLASFSKAYNFNDRVAATQFCIPSGYKFRLFQHEKHRGEFIDLVGTGELATQHWGNRGLRQRWSSGCFMNEADRCL